MKPKGMRALHTQEGGKRVRERGRRCMRESMMMTI